MKAQKACLRCPAGCEWPWWCAPIFCAARGPSSCCHLSREHSVSGPKRITPRHNASVCLWRKTDAAGLHSAQIPLSTATHGSHDAKKRGSREAVYCWAIKLKFRFNSSNDTARSRLTLKALCGLRKASGTFRTPMHLDWGFFLQDKLLNMQEGLVD